MAYLKRILLLCAVLAISGVTLMTASGPAMAQPADAETKAAALKAFKAGKKAFDAGDYDTALTHFKEADRVYPGASPKHKIAVCLDKMGRVKDAIAAYGALVDSGPGPKYAARVRESKDRVAELEQQLASMPGKITLIIEPADAAGLAVTVDGSPAEGMELELEGGDHTVVVEATGMEQVTRQITVEPGESQEVSITLAASADAAPPPPPPEEESDTDQGLLIGGLVSAGVAVVGWGVFTAFGVMAMGSKSDFEDTPTTELADDTEQHALIADIGLAVGGVGTIVAAILIPMALMSGDEEGAGDAAAMPRLAPIVGPEAAGMAATWTF
ncbi:MAG: tetratricopeptide repeat protein [Deltaproteobacteria bacterium]|jgi:hypothetical protein|nr:tetratricopeptide repeat protein [Deltaproteobacteria bacterium]MBW2534332.1 tetratricopeptide repeat protein [Deltaproteobacteria bacterium]